MLSRNIIFDCVSVLHQTCQIRNSSISSISTVAIYIFSLSCSLHYPTYLQIILLNPIIQANEKANTNYDDRTGPNSKWLTSTWDLLE